jgi:hypothetical protein
MNGQAERFRNFRQKEKSRRTIFGEAALKPEQRHLNLFAIDNEQTPRPPFHLQS